MKIKVAGKKIETIKLSKKVPQTEPTSEELKECPSFGQQDDGIEECLICRDEAIALYKKCAMKKEEDMKVSLKNKKTEGAAPAAEGQEKKVAAKKVSKKGTGPGRAKVEIPEELYSHPEIGKLLKDYKKEATREGRIALRSKGFKLSDPESWKPFLKASAKAVKK